MGKTLPNKRMYPVTRVGLLTSGIPERYWSASLKPLVDGETKKRLVQYLSGVHRYVAEGRGLYLHGPFETGKTFAAVAILKEVLRRGGSGFFLKARDILRAIYDMEETEDGSALIRNVIRRVDILVLDDLGAEGFDPQKHGGAELEGIVRDRYDAKRSIIVTSNRSPKQLEEKYTTAFLNILRRNVDTLAITTNQWKKGK